MFVRFTSPFVNGDADPNIYVNPQIVSYVRRMQGHTTIHFSDESPVFVQEAPEEVVNAINLSLTNWRKGYPPEYYSAPLPAPPVDIAKLKADLAADKQRVSEALR